MSLHPTEPAGGSAAAMGMRNTPRKLAIGIAAIGFAVRLALAIALGLDAAPKPGSDQEEYDIYAWNVAQGRGYRGPSADVADGDHLTAYRPPGASLIWASLYAAFGHRYDVIRIAHCLAGAVSVYLVFAIGRRCCGDGIGLLAAAATAVFPTVLIYTVDLLAEAFGILFFLAFILACLCFAERPGFWRGALAGTLLGISILTRPNSVFMVPLMLPWAAWQFRGNLRHLALAAAIPLAAAAALAPWTLRNYRVFDRIIPISTLGGSGLLQGNNDVVVTDPKYFGYSFSDSRMPEYRAALASAGDEVERDRRARQFAVDWLKSHPDRWWFLVRHKFWRSVTPFLQPESPRLYRIGMLVSWGPVLVLFSLAFFPTLTKSLRDRNPAWLLHLAFLHYILTSVIFYALSRYRVTVEPLCIIVALCGARAALMRWGFKERACAPHAVHGQ